MKKGYTAYKTSRKSSVACLNALSEMPMRRRRRLRSRPANCPSGYEKTGEVPEGWEIEDACPAPVTH
jgi:hypothetical protein